MTQNGICKQEPALKAKALSWTHLQQGPADHEVNLVPYDYTTLPQEDAGIEGEASLKLHVIKAGKEGKAKSHPNTTPKNK